MERTVRSKRSLFERRTFNVESVLSSIGVPNEHFLHHRCRGGCDLRCGFLWPAPLNMELPQRLRQRSCRDDHSRINMLVCQPRTWLRAEDGRRHRDEMRSRQTESLRPRVLFTTAAIALSRFGPRSQRKLDKPGDWSAYSTEYARFSPRSLLAFDGRSGSGCVLRTASVSISRSSALVFGGSRV